MSLDEFISVLEMLNIAVKDEYKDNMTLHAYGAWQVIETMKAMMLGDKYRPITFAEYARKMNLIEDEPVSKLQKQLEKESALKTAEEIIRIDRGQVS
jgi:hypothetical protein